VKYFFFLDETGDHGLNYVDNNFPLFLLCGCLVREDHLKSMQTSVAAMKHRFFSTDKVILHSRDIRKCEGSFQILFDLNIKAAFYQELNTILGESEYAIIGSGINKIEHIKKYGKGAKDPYSLALSFVIERMVFCLDRIDKDSTIELLVEERGKKEDGMLLAHFNATMDRGTYYVTPARLKRKIVRFGFHSKKENIVGLQIADLCAYPLARSILNPDEPYVPFQIIKGKIYCNDKGEYEGWGLKIFP
jgi:hypothetical protein